MLIKVISNVNGIILSMMLMAVTLIMIMIITIIMIMKIITIFLKNLTFEFHLNSIS